jgi:hypothetical protein
MQAAVLAHETGGSLGLVCADLLVDLEKRFVVAPPSLGSLDAGNPCLLTTLSEKQNEVLDGETTEITSLADWVCRVKTIVG